MAAKNANCESRSEGELTPAEQELAEIHLLPFSSRNQDPAGGAGGATSIAVAVVPTAVQLLQLLQLLQDFLQNSFGKLKQLFFWQPVLQVLQQAGAGAAQAGAAAAQPQLLQPDFLLNSDRR